jgi:hypothetical protein
MRLFSHLSYPFSPFFSPDKIFTTPLRPDNGIGTTPGQADFTDYTDYI